MAFFQKSVASIIKSVAAEEKSVTSVSCHKETTATEVEELCQALTRNKYVTTLKFEKVPFLNAQMITPLAVYVTKTLTLRELWLHGCGIGAESALVFFGAMTRNSSVETLSLKDNDIHSAEGVALMLQHNKTVTSLNLDGNHLGDCGDKELFAIVKALQGNQQLAALHLANNNVSETAAQEFCSLLRAAANAPALSMLDISGGSAFGNVSMGAKVELRGLLQQRAPAAKARQRDRSATMAANSAQRFIAGVKDRLTDTTASNNTSPRPGFTPRDDKTRDIRDDDLRDRLGSAMVHIESLEQAAGTLRTELTTMRQRAEAAEAELAKAKVEAAARQMEMQEELEQTVEKCAIIQEYRERDQHAATDMIKALQAKLQQACHVNAKLVLDRQSLHSQLQRTEMDLLELIKEAEKHVNRPMQDAAVQLTPRAQGSGTHLTPRGVAGGRSPATTPRSARSDDEELLDFNIITDEEILRTMSVPKDQWVRDKVVANCSLCVAKFSLTRRKHHCRHCGKIFCKECCEKYQGIRLCKPCATS